MSGLSLHQPACQGCGMVSLRRSWENVGAPSPPPPISQGALPTGFRQGSCRTCSCLAEAGVSFQRLCPPLGKYIRQWLHTATSLWLVCTSHVVNLSVAGCMRSSMELLNSDMGWCLTDSCTQQTLLRGQRGVGSLLLGRGSWQVTDIASKASPFIPGDRQTTKRRPQGTRASSEKPSDIWD